MKKRILFGVFMGMLTMAGPVWATVNVDSAANYSGGWTNGSNGGDGFGAWSITANAGSGWSGNGIWASSNADLNMGNAFGYVAKGDGSYITLDRPFAQAMGTGDVFALDLGMNYDSGTGGNKGFVLRSADNRELVTINQAGSQTITLNGNNALTNYGTTTMHWTFTQKSATQITVYATGRSGSEAYSTTVNATGAAFVANIHFYASSITNDAYAEYRQAYFDNLTLSQGISSTNLFMYAVENSQACVTTILASASGDIVIPATLGGYPVTAVGPSAGKDCTNMTGLAFASGGSMTNLGATAFQGCTRLTLAILPTGITSIPVGLFYGCTGLVSVTIPSGVTQIGDTAFADCRSLTGLTIPTGLKLLGESAFLNCRSLTSLDVPSGITSIPGQLCYECRALTSITLPSGITNIGYAAFYHCGLTSLALPNSVTAIGHDAFHGCTGLTSISIDSALSTVGDQAFYDCTLLENLFFYGGVSSLGEGVFGNCSALAGVYFVCNAPSLGADAGTNMFVGADNVTVYYLVNPSTWSNTFCGVDAEAWTPVLMDPTPTASAFNFNVEWANGEPIRVQACTNLLAPNWINLSTSIITNGSCLISDTNWTSLEQRYYRVSSTN